MLARAVVRHSVRPLTPPLASDTLPMLAQGGDQAHLGVEG